MTVGTVAYTAPQAAMRYQHAAQGRDPAVAAAFSKIAIGR
jgi:hypothetical protein